MSVEDVPLIDDTTIDNLFKKRDFFKINHQQGAQFKTLNQNNEFIVGKVNKF